MPVEALRDGTNPETNLFKLPFQQGWRHGVATAWACKMVIPGTRGDEIELENGGMERTTDIDAGNKIIYFHAHGMPDLKVGGNKFIGSKPYTVTKVIQPQKKDTNGPSYFYRLVPKNL